MIDIRDQKHYTTKKVGTLVWMMTNLSYDVGSNKCATVTTSPAKITVSTVNANCAANGRYYDWNVATASSGTCPGGWRLPTAQEYVTAHLSLALKNTGVIITEAIGIEFDDTGFYWTQSAPADVGAVTNHCLGASCGVAYISKEGPYARFYPQINTPSELMPVRCVRNP